MMHTAASPYRYPSNSWEFPKKWKVRFANNDRHARHSFRGNVECAHPWLIAGVERAVRADCTVPGIECTAVRLNRCHARGR